MIKLFSISMVYTHKSLFLHFPKRSYKSVKSHPIAEKNGI